MRACLQFFGVREDLRNELKGALVEAFPNLEVSEVAGCDIGPGRLNIVHCELFELPEGHLPFMGPLGAMIQPQKGLLWLFTTKAKAEGDQVLTALSVAVTQINKALPKDRKRHKIHSVMVFDDKRTFTVGTKGGRAVKATPRESEALFI